MGLIDRWLHRFAGTPSEAVRKIQMGGLVRTAGLVSKVMRRASPDAGEMPSWIREVFVAVVDRMCAYDNPEMPDPRKCGATEAALEFLEGTPPETREELQSLLVFVEISPFLLGPERSRFTSLEAESKGELLRRWEQSPLDPMRGGFRALKSMVMMGYWSRPETFGAIGYSVSDNPGVPDPQQNDWEHLEDEGAA